MAIEADSLVILFVDVCRESGMHGQSEASPNETSPIGSLSTSSSALGLASCVMSKCTFCYHKISRGPEGVADLDEANPETKEFTPAYVRVCAPKARFFGDLDNPDSKVNELIAEKGGVRLKEETGNKSKAYCLSGGGSPVVPGNCSRQS